MDPRPIGIFDSGLGGLTAARTLEELLPGETLIYFGDSANAPYGIRTREQLLALAGANTDFLLRFDVKAILVACGTVSSTVIGRVRERCAVPMFDVLEAACRGAAALGAKRVAVTATEATVKSGAFPRRLGELDGTMEVFSKACQSLVAAVEAGHFRPGAAELAPVRDWRPELLLLACTHFPLLDAVISAYLGPEVRTLSVSREAAAALSTYLRERDLLAPPEAESKSRWFTSGDPEPFAAYGGLFLGHPITPERHVAHRL